MKQLKLRLYALGVFVVLLFACWTVCSAGAAPLLTLNSESYVLGSFVSDRARAQSLFTAVRNLWASKNLPHKQFMSVEQNENFAPPRKDLSQSTQNSEKPISKKQIKNKRDLSIWFVPFLVIVFVLCGLLMYVFFLQRNKRQLKLLVEQRTKELSLSEKRFRHLVADLPKIAVQGYNKNRSIIYWNRASERLYGYSEQEAMGQKLEDLIIPQVMQESVIRAIRNWYEHDQEIPSSELILKHKNGNDVPVYSSHVMLTGGADGKEMYCVDLDLADLKEALEKKQKSESFYRQLFDHSSSGVAVYEAVDDGKDFIFKDFNRAGEKIENKKRDKLIGCRITEAFPGVKNFGLLDVLRQVWKTGKPVHHPVTLYKDEKIKGWRENRVYKLPTGEVVSVYDDISKERQLEEEKRQVEMQLQRAQKMEALGLLAGGVAHDLNNILTGITGYPELMLLQLDDGSKLRKPLEAIKESGERAAAVVADLLTVARGVASTKTVNNLNKMVSVYLDSPEYRYLRAQYPKVTCHLKLDENLPDILCSPVHIQKCIMNLVTNGAEAIEKEGTIILSTTVVQPDPQWAKENGLKKRQYVVLSITDTGIGIAEKDVEHVFEPFYSKKVMGRSGTGLGLAVVWNSMEDHEGRIFVRSSDKGTCFQLYFPLSDKKEGETGENGQEEQANGNNEYILVVDDDPLLRDIASQMLEVSGYQVDSVASGELAVQFVKEHPVDLIVLDMLMEPGMNGYQTYKEIVAFNPGQKAIVASGFSENENVKEAIRIGAGGFIKKPYSMAQLSHAVKEALDT